MTHTNGKDVKTEAVTESKSNVHPLVNMLVQLQELILVRSEQDAAMNHKHLAPLDTSIQQLLEAIPAETRLLFQKLEKKDVLAIVPISNNVCSGCGLTLPVSLVHSVRACERLHQCTNCSRILFYPEVRPRRVGGKVAGRSEPRRAGIARFSSQALMISSLKANNRDGVIAELAGRMESEGFVDSSARLLKEALAREAIINTAVDFGIAFPHVRGVEGGGLALALGINRKGVKFDPTGKVLTHIFFFIVIPTAASVFYLRLLSGLTRTFAKKDAREKLIKATNPQELWDALVKTTRLSIK